MAITSGTWDIKTSKEALEHGCIQDNFRRFILKPTILLHFSRNKYNY
jgi:hypothetical protein